MTAATDLTVKKNDGTTDIVWSLIAASGGDKAPAVWRSLTANSGTVGQKPTFQISTKWNAAGDVRRADVSASWPAVYTNTTTSQTEVRAKMNFSGSFAVPQNISNVDIAEFSAQVANLVATTLIKNSISAGFAPT